MIFVFITVLKILSIVVRLLISVAYFIVAERKIMAFVVPVLSVYGILPAGCYFRLIAVLSLLEVMTGSGLTSCASYDPMEDDKEYRDWIPEILWNCTSFSHEAKDIVALWASDNSDLFNEHIFREICSELDLSDNESIRQFGEDLLDYTYEENKPETIKMIDSGFLTYVELEYRP